MNQYDIARLVEDGAYCAERMREKYRYEGFWAGLVLGIFIGLLIAIMLISLPQQKEQEETTMARTSTWSNVGRDVQECTNMEQVLAASGLDYTVEKRPVFFSGNMSGSWNGVPNRFATIRTSDNHHLPGRSIMPPPRWP